jgi:mono/diheme cytochrome c family protein
MVMRSAVALAVAAVLMPAVAAAQASPPKPYRQACQMCHQSGAKGLAGQFPRLAGRVDDIAASPEGRRYLISVVLYGLTGRITVDGQPIAGIMTPVSGLPDADIATTLTYLVRLENGAKAKPFSAAEVAAVRAGERMNPSQVRALREQLVSTGLIP